MNFSIRHSKFKIRNLFVALSLLILVSCSEDETSIRSYESGVFIANEGTFGSGNGTITYYEPETEKARQNIFTDGDFAGDVIQSLTFHDDQAFIVRNGDNKVEAVNGTTFKPSFTISDASMISPRYVTVAGNTAYISVWGAYDENFMLTDSRVLVYDLDAKEVVTSIQTDEGTENLLLVGTKLFAANYNYGSSSTVSVISTTNNTLIDELEVAAGPAGMTLDANGKLWVICQGAFGSENGWLYRIDPATLDIEETITITGSAGIDIATTPDKHAIIYSVGNDVYQLAITAIQEPATPLFTASDVTSLSTLNLEPVTGEIYIGDTPSFTAAGTVYRYSATGTKLDSFTAGIGPGQVVFK